MTWTERFCRDRRPRFGGNNFIFEQEDQEADNGRYHSQRTERQISVLKQTITKLTNIFGTILSQHRQYFQSEMMLTFFLNGGTHIAFCVSPVRILCRWDIPATDHLQMAFFYVGFRPAFIIAKTNNRTAEKTGICGTANVKATLPMTAYSQI